MTASRNRTVQYGTTLHDVTKRHDGTESDGVTSQNLTAGRIVTLPNGNMLQYRTGHNGMTAQHVTGHNGATKPHSTKRLDETEPDLT